jgi:hypothetical protein
MGYEVKMYVGSVSNHSKREDKNWFQEFAMLEMCKIDRMPHHLLEKGTPIFFYGTDGNTEITEDCYGDKLLAVPIDLVRDYFKKLAKDDYLRYFWAYTLLNTMTTKSKELRAKNENKHGRIPTHVFFFGH